MNNFGFKRNFIRGVYQERILIAGLVAYAFHLGVKIAYYIAENYTLN